MSPDGPMFVQGARRKRASLNLSCGGQRWEEENRPETTGHVQRELDLHEQHMLPSGLDRNWLLSPCLLSGPCTHPQGVWGCRGSTLRGSGAMGRPEPISSLSAGTQRGEMGKQGDRCPLV